MQASAKPVTATMTVLIVSMFLLLPAKATRLWRFELPTLYTIAAANESALRMVAAGNIGQEFEQKVKSGIPSVSKK